MILFPASCKIIGKIDAPTGCHYNDFYERNDIMNELSLETAVVNRLIEKKWHIAFAESCTGGLAAGRLVNVPDASRVLDVSFITYANEAKMKYLQVPQDLIDTYGVVSEEVAGAMARGAAKAAADMNEAAGCEVGVATSGIAGPSGAVPGKPVGTVCFGFYINGKTITHTCHFDNMDRNAVRAGAVDFVYQSLIDLLA